MWLKINGVNGGRLELQPMQNVLSVHVTDGVSSFQFETHVEGMVGAAKLYKITMDVGSFDSFVTEHIQAISSQFLVPMDATELNTGDISLSIGYVAIVITKEQLLQLRMFLQNP